MSFAYRVSTSDEKCKSSRSISVQTELKEKTQRDKPIFQIANTNLTVRPLDECLKDLKERKTQIIDDFHDEEIFELVKLKHIPLYKLESYFTDPIRGVSLR